MAVVKYSTGYIFYRKYVVLYLPFEQRLELHYRGDKSNNVLNVYTFHEGTKNSTVFVLHKPQIG